MAPVAVGDTVRLRGGGPVMTVAALRAVSGGEVHALCEWIAGGGLVGWAAREEAWFSLAVLAPVAMALSVAAVP